MADKALHGLDSASLSHLLSPFCISGQFSVHHTASRICVFYVGFPQPWIWLPPLHPENSHWHSFFNWKTIALQYCVGFPGGSDGKASAYNAGDPGLIPGWGSSPGEGNGTPLQYSCLENPMDGGAREAKVHGVAKSQTRLSYFTSLHFCHTHLYFFLKESSKLSIF